MRWSSGAACGIHHSTTMMITNTNDNVREDVLSTGPVTAAVSAGEVFFGIDAADVRQVVTQIVAGESPKPAQGMTKETLLKQVAKRLKAGFRVHCVYEAGPTGFALARELIGLGAECLVVRARRLERYGRRRKNDKRDSRQLALDLAHHCAGRTGLLFPVRIPSPEEELKRLPSREREALNDVRHQLLRSARGRALALGYRLPKEWWRPRVLPKLIPELPANLARLLQRAAAAAAAIKEQLDAVEAEIIAEAPPAPVGVGAVTAGVLEREVLDWGRFKSGKKAGSFYWAVAVGRLDRQSLAARAGRQARQLAAAFLVRGSGLALAQVPAALSRRHSEPGIKCATPTRAARNRSSSRSPGAFSSIGGACAPVASRRPSWASPSSPQLSPTTPTHVL